MGATTKRRTSDGAPRSCANLIHREDSVEGGALVALKARVVAEQAKR
jgi:hypothetical protein